MIVGKLKKTGRVGKANQGGICSLTGRRSLILFHIVM